MHEHHSIPVGTVTTDYPLDPLGPVAMMPSVIFGAREAALAGVGAVGSDGDQPPSAAFTWHITCSSITVAAGAAENGDQT